VLQVFVPFLISTFAIGAQETAPALRTVACSVRDGAPMVAARSRFINFPDGRELTIVGHYHGTREFANGPIESLKRLSTFRGTTPAFRTEILRILAQDPSASVDSRDDVLFLRDALANKLIKFVAVEASVETVEMNLKSYAQVRQSFLSELTKLHLRDATMDVQAYAFGADFFLRLSEPSLFKGRSFIGVEDEKLGRVYENSLTRLEKARSQIARATFDPQVAIVMTAFLNALPGRYNNYHPEKDDAMIATEARSRFTAGDFAKIDPYLRAQLAVMGAMKARDRHNVEGLLKQKSSGVMFIGSSHLESMAALLRERCEMMLRATSAH
jgi:hypothetical protein